MYAGLQALLMVSSPTVPITQHNVIVLQDANQDHWAVTLTDAQDL